MKIGFKILVMVLCIAILFSVAGCGRRQTSSGYWVGSDYELTETESENDNSGNDNTSEKDEPVISSNNPSSNAPVRNEEDLWKIKRDIKPGAKSSVMKNLNFKGKTFTFLDWTGNHSEKDDAMIKAFSQKYNCKIKVTTVDFESYLTVMATAISSGKPYDIVKFAAAFMPQVAISSLAQPLEDYISQADLTTSSKKTGVDWDNTIANATWGNHVYYLVGHRPTFLSVMFYNKLLYSDYGLEDPLTLYKKGQWTWDKVKQQAAVVKNANTGVYLYDKSVPNMYLQTLIGGRQNFYKIDTSGKVTWTGPTTEIYNAYTKQREMYNLSPLMGTYAQSDNFESGKCMLWISETAKYPRFEPIFKKSAALGNNLANVGVVPIPTSKETKNAYMGEGCSSTGYTALRGADPTAAIAYFIYTTEQSEPWESCETPAIQANKELMVSLYDKINLENSYYFLTAEGKRIEQVIYNMYTEIDAGGDIMKLLESYAPKVKPILENSLAYQ